jgi:integrase
VGRKVERTLTPVQVTELVDVVRTRAGEPYALLVDLMASVGLRYGEATALRCGDLDLVRQVIEVRRAVVEVTRTDGPVSGGRRREGNLIWGPTKSGRPRITPLPRHLREPLAGLIAGHADADLLFRSERGGKVIRRNTLIRKLDWRATTQSLGHYGLRIHDLRATAATNSLAAGVPPHVVRDILGHQDLRVTSLYARPHDNALDLAADSLAAYMNQTHSPR